MDPKFFKIRLVTWNMHDSLPKGELEELFGKVPLYDNSTAKPARFPVFSNEVNLYHLVVVAGQECPTPSGIPMGLTAGLRILDKDRDKSKEFEKEHDKPRSLNISREKDRNSDHRSPKEDEETEYPASGWTSMVEDYLCHNGGSTSRVGTPTIADVGFPRPLMRQKSGKETRRGPYQLLIKDRLMGIYLAVYIHRDLKHLVQGMSKSAVTAGLIGGRVGNKGGVGISLNIDGTSFLFLNAHLAAHGGKVNHRLANLSKIKSELLVDDFLSSDDPRKGNEDLTDRFDFTFLLGDLNFRLDISRLHADWLIARQEYAQAFEFDQLHALMKDGHFRGFQEATINFPPTFKYDVLRTLKRSRSKRSLPRLVRIGDRHEVDDHDHEIEDTEDGEEDMEVVSLASSNMTSIISRAPSEPEDDSYFPYSSPTTPGVNSVDKSSPISLLAANKAKVKWLSLLSPSFPSKSHKARKVELWSPDPSAPVSVIPSSPLLPDTPNSSSEVPKRRFLRPPPMILVNSTEPQTSPQGSVLEERGVYDSSSKKRVPSWCDRILWKTTVKPDPIDDQTSDIEIPLRSRNRGVGHFFTSAFRPSPSRTMHEPNTPLPIREEKTQLPSSIPWARNSPRSSTDFIHPSPLPTSKYPDSRARRTNTAFSPPPTAPLPLEYPTRRGTGVESPPSSTLWRFLPAFLSPTHIQGPAALDLPQILPSPPPRLKGDVICLNYNTLDDRGMRRLEGRSDHRPVIGTYAVYA